MAFKFGLFAKTRELDKKINEFLNNISEAAILYAKHIAFYIDSGAAASDEFDHKIREVSGYEARNDYLRREIEVRLYMKTLIPESRSDVMKLLEGLDKILNKFEENLIEFSIERPEIPEHAAGLLKELAENTSRTVETIILSSRAFFMNVTAVNDHIHKVMFFKRQGDQICYRLKRKIFADESLPLSHKNQLREFADTIAGIAEWAEDVGDALAIYAIKQMV